MTGVSDLGILLASLAPRLTEGEFVFCSFADAVYGDHADLQPVAAVSEPEGLTLIVPKSIAEARSLASSAAYRMITLGVHSSLEAVGLTAAVATQLTAHGISANMVAAFHHDHIFVPREHAERAIAALDALTR